MSQPDPRPPGPDPFRAVADVYLEGRPAGCAFFVNKRTCVTAAHVAGEQGVGGVVDVRFRGARTQATVTGWWPITPRARGTDVAVLTLDPQVRSAEPLLLDEDDVPPVGQSVVVVNPSQQIGGMVRNIGMAVEVRRPEGVLTDALEIVLRRPPGDEGTDRADPWVPGAPVVRTDSGRVVGMVVIGDRDAAFCIPAAGIRQALADSVAQQRVAADLPGTVAPPPVATEWVPGYAADTTEGEDSLDVRPSVHALAALIAARSLTPPASIGLFGDWGAGKSFFMRQMRRRIRRLATEARAAQDAVPDQTPAAVSSYCSAIRQVTFNAWHYADTNLWASLAAHIFDSLASRDTEDDDADPVTLEQSTLRDTLQEREVQRRLLAGTLAVVEAEEKRLTSERVSSLLPVLRDAVRAQDLDTLTEALGTTDPSVADVRAEAGRLGTAAGQIHEIWTELRHGRRRSWVPVAAAAGVGLVVAALFLVFTRVWPRPLAALAPGALTLLAAVAAATDRVLRVSRAARRLVQGVEQAQADALQPLADKRERLQRELAALDTEIQHLNARAEALEPARRLERFLEERGASADYRQHLGVVALARRDFEILAGLIASGRSSSATGQLERVVLYIDDLDRCPPEIVVKVLEAVHLLLALPLFVVVVAVDPRWLLRAVQHHYRTMLAPVGSEALPGRRLATALDYLEKIFQIPFALPVMESDGFARLITAALRPANQAGGVDSTSTTPTSMPEDEAASDTSVDTGDSGGALSEGTRSPLPELVESEEQVELRPRALTIEDSEIDLLGRLGGLIPTPRAAKRMANIYQLIRVQVPTAELDAFVGKPERPGRCAPTMLLLAVLVGFPQHADVFLRRVSRAAPGERLMSLLDSAEGQGLKRLRIALTALAESEGPWPPLVEAYRTEIPRVSGFSFRTAVDLELTSIGAEGTWGNVAAAAHNAGPPAEVLALYERTLAERERILGAEHPDTLISRMDLAGAYEAAGRLPEAMPLLKRAATDTERLRDPAHPALAAVLYRLGVAHARLGDLAAAVAAFDRAVEVDTAAYGPDHPEVATDLEALAAVLGQQGNADGAAAAQARAQRIRQQQKKPGVPTE